MADKSVIPPIQPPTFGVGDRVKIKHFAGKRGRVVELRGPLGPKGAQVYRVRVMQKTPAYIELLGDQIVRVAPGGKGKGKAKLPAI